MRRAPDHAVWGEVACLLSRKRDAIPPMRALGLLPGEVSGPAVRSSMRLCDGRPLRSCVHLPRVGAELLGSSRHLFTPSIGQAGALPASAAQVALSSALPFLKGALWGAGERRRSAAVARSLRRSEHVGLLGQLADARQR